MNRRLSMVLAAYGVWSQATVLFFLDPMKRQVSDLVEPEATVGEVQLLGLSLEGFAVRDLHQVQGWLPQVVFLLLSGLLTYGVLRASGAMRPRLGTVLALGGAALLAAGVATLTGPALDPDAVTVMPPTTTGCYGHGRVKCPARQPSSRCSRCGCRSSSGSWCGGTGTGSPCGRISGPRRAPRATGATRTTGAARVGRSPVRRRSPPGPGADSSAPG